MVVMGVLFYRWKYGHYPSLCSRRQSTATTTGAIDCPRRRHRVPQGVRRQVEFGLPGYTLRPTRGELSLGVGRKRSGDEEYELAETTTHVESTNSAIASSSAERNMEPLSENVR